MSTAVPYRRVTTREEIDRVQTYLSGHFPYSLKLYCTIRSWQQQAATATSDEDLIEPVFPSLYVGCNHDHQTPTDTQENQFDIVVLMYGCPVPVLADRERAGAIACAAAVDPKPPCPPVDIYMAFFAPDDASDRLYQVLGSLLPTSLCFQSFGNPSQFNSVLERLAEERGAQLQYNLHQQWVKPDERHDKVQFLEPAALALFSRPSPTSSPPPAPSSSEAAAAIVISPSNGASAAASSSPSDAAVTVAPLEVSHAAMVERWWPYASAGTAKIMPYILEHLPSRCVYVDGEPACWALAQNYGGIGMLHTREQHRGKGYARQCIDSLCAALVELGQTPFCFIGNANVASQKVFHSLGFKPSHYVDWIVWVPKQYSAEPTTH